MQYIGEPAPKGKVGKKIKENNQMNYSDHLAVAVGDGKIPQDIVDAGLEIALAETDAELLQAAKRYRNLTAISARGNAMNQQSRISAKLSQMRLV